MTLQILLDGLQLPSLPMLALVQHLGATGSLSLREGGKVGYISHAHIFIGPKQSERTYSTWLRAQKYRLVEHRVSEISSFNSELVENILQTEGTNVPL